MLMIMASSIPISRSHVNMLRVLPDSGQGSFQMIVFSRDDDHYDYDHEDEAESSSFLISAAVRELWILEAPSSLALFG